MENKKEERKVYVVLREHEDGTSVQAIYEEEKDASDLVDRHMDSDWENWKYEEMSVISKQEEKKEYIFRVVVFKTGINSCSEIDIEDSELDGSGKVRLLDYGIEINDDRTMELNLDVMAPSKAEAEKIALSYRDELIKAGKWIYTEK